MKDQAATVLCFEHATIARDCMDTLQALGFNVIRIPYSAEVFTKLPFLNFDYLFSINFNPLLSQAAEALRKPYIAWVVDTPCYGMHHDAISNPLSFTFVYDLAVASRLKERSNGNIYYLPVAVNELRQLPAEPVYDHDISFIANLTPSEYQTHIKPRLAHVPLQTLEELIGRIDMRPLTAQLTESHIRLVKEVYPLSGLLYLSEYEKLAYLLGREHSYRERVSCIQALAARFERVAVYGNSEWVTHTDTYCGYAEHYQAMPRLFQRSRINLNLTRSFVESGLPMRVFDILGAGGFMVTNDKEDLHHLFTPGKDLVIFRDQQDLQEICRYYLSHEEERAAIAAHGQQTVLAHHTYRARLISLFQTVQSALASMQYSGAKRIRITDSHV
ncbi:glycosyltransferase [Aeromonas veronii]